MSLKDFGKKKQQTHPKLLWIIWTWSYYKQKASPIQQHSEQNPDAGRMKPSIFNYFSFLLLLTCPCSVQKYQETIYSRGTSGPVFQAQESLLVQTSVIRWTKSELHHYFLLCHYRWRTWTYTLSTIPVIIARRFPSVLGILNWCPTPKAKDFNRKLKKLWQVGIHRRYAVLQED